MRAVEEGALGSPPFGLEEVAELSRERSQATRKLYGVERVCRMLDIPRSTVYARRKSASQPTPKPAKRGPKPLISDAALLEVICEDLATSEFVGEGHRKVWLCFKFGQGLRVGRKRVLRLMRENNLKSPCRRLQSQPNPPDGSIGADTTKVFTADEEYVWVFASVKHWSAGMVIHVTKRGDGVAALQPEAQGRRGSHLARGLALRMDHG